MTFTDFLFRRGNPTNEWVRDASRRLSVDLGRATIDSVGLGEPFQELSFLGRDEDSSAARASHFCYYSLGLAIDVDDDGTICTFSVVANEPPFQPFAGTALFRGQPLDLRRLSEGNLESTFGPCYWRDREDEETIVFYELRTCEWEFELSPEGALKRLVLERKPVLAKEEQREAYRVTKPWPPEYLEAE